MPIRPEIRRFYDARWRKFRLTALAAAGYRCQRCGRPHRLLNVAHLSHDPADRRSLPQLSRPQRYPAKNCHDPPHPRPTTSVL